MMQSSRERQAAFWGRASVAVLLLTVLVLPWLHGGAMPLAGLVLQLGAFLAGGLSLVSGWQRRDIPGFPPVVFPLAVLAVIGLLQLLPIHAPLISQMNHSVRPELRDGFSAAGERQLELRTASPADTRAVLAQVTALMVLALAAYDQLKERQVVKLCLAMFAGNAALMSVLAILQKLNGTLFLIRDEWWTGRGSPFGAFVNPNNAAIWLCIGLASAVGVVLLQLEETSLFRAHQQRGWKALQLAVVRQLAELNSARILMWVSAALIVCGILASRSRGGMLSAGAAVVVLVVARMRGARVVGGILLLVVASAVVWGATALLDLQGQAVDELETLSDLSGELSGRVRHWRDSLELVRDFPVLGAGLGAYRYVTLPYQTRPSDYWYQNADNQYVEVVVEAGLVGLVAFVMIGIPTLLRCLLILRASVSGGRGPAVETVATVLLFSTTAIGVSAATDYGVTLPSVAALYVVLVSMLSAVQAEFGVSWMKPPGRATSVGMRLLLVAGGIVFVPEQLAAQKCYQCVISGQRLAEKPLSREVIAENEQLLRHCTELVEGRPDDGRLRELQSRLQRNILRAQFLEGLPGMDRAERFQEAWPYTEVMSIGGAVHALANQPQQQQHLKSVTETRIRSADMLEQYQETRRFLPLPGVVLRRLARWGQLLSDSALRQRYSAAARFNEPAVTELNLHLGQLAWYDGEEEVAREVWEEGLQVSEKLRVSILAVFGAIGQTERGVELFGPRTYSQSVEALVGAAEGPLRDLLLEKADSLWEPPVGAPSPTVQRLRDDHLRLQHRSDDRLEWLLQCVEWSPQDVEFRKRLAASLSAAGQLEQSLDQWHEVQLLAPRDPLPEREILTIRRRLEHQESRP